MYQVKVLLEGPLTKHYFLHSINNPIFTGIDIAVEEVQIMRVNYLVAPVNLVEDIVIEVEDHQEVNMIHIAIVPVLNIGTEF